MEKLQFRCWCGTTRVNLPFGVWEMTLQALQEKEDHIFTTWYAGFYRHLPHPYFRLLFMV